MRGRLSGSLNGSIRWMPLVAPVRLSVSGRHAYIAQLARISVQNWASVQLELSSTYCRARGTSAATTKNGIRTTGRVRAWFQPDGPDSHRRFNGWTVSRVWLGAGCALMLDPSAAGRTNLAGGSAGP